MRRGVALAVAGLSMGLLSAAGLASCKSDVAPASGVVVSVTSEAALGQSIDRVTIVATRGGAPIASSSLVPPSPDAGTTQTFPLVLALDSGGDVGAPIDVVVTGLKAGKPHVVREAQLSFVAGHSKLLSLSLRYSCLDAPLCASGQTCRGGACAPAKTDSEKLPDYDIAHVYGITGDNSCFDDTYGGCFDGAESVDLDAMKASADCTLPLAVAVLPGTQACGSTGGAAGAGGAGPLGGGGTAGLGGSVGAGGFAGKGGSGGSAGTAGAGGSGGPLGTAPSSPGTGLNLAARFVASQEDDPTLFVALDRDDVEGFTADGTSVRLAPGLCQTLKAGKITGIQLSRACAPKTITQPVCRPLTEDEEAQPSTTLGAGDGTPTDARLRDCATFAKALCKTTTRCFPDAKYSVGSGSDCVREGYRQCVRELSAPGADQTPRTSCVFALLGSDCAPFYSSELTQDALPSECTRHGSLSAGTPCAVDGQCATGYCDAPFGDCGVCRDHLPLGSPCELDIPCGRGSHCESFGTGSPVCVPSATVGQSCVIKPPPDGGGSAPPPCPGTRLVCKAGSCVVPDARPGDGCDGGTGCESALYDLSCVDTIDAGVLDGGGKQPVPQACKPTPRFPTLGDPCQNNCDYRAFCYTITCGTTPIGTCVPRRKAGEECGALDGGAIAECAADLDCFTDGGSGTCGSQRPYSCGSP